MTKFKVNVEMYGTVLEKNTAIIEAETEEQARSIAIDQCEQGTIEFPCYDNALNGMEYQTTDVEKQS
jgi:hypothetical protein